MGNPKNRARVPSRKRKTKIGDNSSSQVKRIVVEEEEQPVIEETTVRPTAEAEEEREVARPLSSETAEPHSSSFRKLETAINEYPLQQ